MDKRGFQISFAWLFGIIAGAFILFFAIYTTVRVMDVGQQEIGAKTQKELGVLLNPLETGFEEASITTISLSTPTRIHNTCDTGGNFGRQALQISQKDFRDWSDPAQETYFKNRYIFSKDVVEGKTFYVFTKPFDFPFKVADLTYITSFSENYCFIESPNEIVKEISNINKENIQFVDSLGKIEENCAPESINVCFGEKSGECDIDVYMDGRKVEKNGEEMTFRGNSLLYGAIFSDKNTYECQLNRLIERIKILSKLYIEKEKIVSKENCNPNLKNELNNLIDFIENGNFEDSDDLNGLNFLIEEAENKNSVVRCRLW